MKKLELIYNPFSGDKSFRYSLDPVIAELQGGGFCVSVFRSYESGDIDEHICHIDNDCDTIVASGGDGTVNSVLNAMIKHNKKAKLGVIPSGTANDYASYLGIPSLADKAAAIIAGGKTVPTDIGRANDNYFINVFAAGHFTDISHSIDASFKNAFGKLAYYLKGVEQASSLTSTPLRITNSNETYEDDFYFFLVLNTAGTGGFSRIVEAADIADGLFDFFAVRKVPFMELPTVILNFLKGEHLNDHRILYFQDRYIKVDIDDSHPVTELTQTSIDGEAGISLPVEITNIHKALSVYVP